MQALLNPELFAPNALKVPIDLGAAEDLLELWADPSRRDKLHVDSPAWHSDIRCLSAQSHSDFALFQSAFDRLGIAAHVEPHVDFREAVRMYSGFFVTRMNCAKPNFHVDWR